MHFNQGKASVRNSRPDLENICTKCNLHCSNRGCNAHAPGAWVTATLVYQQWRNFPPVDIRHSACDAPSSPSSPLPLFFLNNRCELCTWCRYRQIRLCECSVWVHPDQRGAVHKRLWGSVIHDCTFPLISSCCHWANPSWSISCEAWAKNMCLQINIINFCCA